MRILVVSINVAPWGGSEELWKSLALKGLAQGNEVMVSVFAHQNLNPNLAELVAHGAILHQRPLPSYYIEQPFSYRTLSELKSRLGMDKTSMDWRAVKAWKPEVVVISSGETFDHYLHHQSYLIAYCKDNSVPFYLISQRNWEWDMSVNQEFRESRRHLIEDCHGFFFVSYQNYKMACSQLAMDIPKARIIQNPLKVNLETNLPYPESSIPKMAYVARLETSIKGQDLFLQALSSQRFSTLDFELTFYGTGPDERHLRELIKYYGLEGKVFFGGHVADVSEIWRTHQLLVLCSLAEGTPLSLIEAMACGRTGLVTQVGDSAIWLSKSGFVVSGHQVENIQKAIQEALDDFSNWRKLGQQCKVRVMEKRDSAEIDGLLECIVEKRRLNHTGQDPEEFLSEMTREEKVNLSLGLKEPPNHTKLRKC